MKSKIGKTGLQILRRYINIMLNFLILGQVDFAIYPRTAKYK